MKYTPLLLFLILLSSGAPSALAQAKPVNDGVSNTLLISEREGSYASQGGSKATAELGEPAVGGQPAKHTVWYRYVAPVDGRYIVEFQDQQGLRAELRFPGNPVTTLPLQTLADGTSNTIAFDEEKLSVDLDRGQQVYLVVDAAQPFSFSWRFVEVVNDYYRDAESITGSSGTVIRGDRGATRSSSEANLGLAYPAIWFEWSAPGTGIYEMDLVGSRQWDGTTFGDFTLRVYDAAGGAPTNHIGTGTGSSLDNSTRVSINATAGHVYFIACHGNLSAPDSQIWLSWYPQGSVGVLAWAQSQYTTSEADGWVYPRLLKLRGDGDGSVRFINDSVDGGPVATGGSDYTLPADPISLPTGTRSAQGGIEIAQDGIFETQERFGVGFTDLTGGLTVQDGTSNTILISEESDTATCGLAHREVRVREGQTAYVELRRLRASDRQVAVGWRVKAGSCRAGVDMPELSGTAYLSPGQISTSIAVPVYQDTIFEGPEYFTVSLSNNPQFGEVTDGTSNTIVVVEDDDFFIPNPGGYRGLVDLGGWGALIQYTLNGAGTASGTVDMMGTTYRFTGAVDAQGQLIASFARNNKPSIGLRLNFAEGWARCAASLRDPEGDFAEGFVRRLPYDGKRSIAPQAGNYTVMCEGQGGGSVVAPAVMTSIVMGDGSVRFIGRTADEQTITTSGRITQSDPEGVITGECAFLLPLYAKAGNLYGTCDFGLGPQQPGGETTLGWMKPWRPKDALYPALPYQSIRCDVVRYTPPTAGQRVTNDLSTTLGDGSVRFINGGTLLDGTSNTILVSETNKVTFPAGNPLNCSITIDAKTGWFSGKIKPPGSTKFTNFYGVFLQGGYGYGRGYWPGSQRSGLVEITADF